MKTKVEFIIVAEGDAAVVEAWAASLMHLLKQEHRVAVDELATKYRFTDVSDTKAH